jgi:uncharacterized Zn finger protein
MAGQAIFAAQLLAGEMPANIEEAFAAAGVSLFPADQGDLVTDCSCPDWANPCKHVAAAHYILGEQLDADPFLLFRLRGRTQEQVMEALHSLRSDGGAEEQAPEPEPQPETFAPLEEQIGSFWQPAERLEGLHMAIKPPAVRLPVLKRLGQPAFLPDCDLAAVLGPAYEAMTAAALAAAYASEGAGERRDQGGPED